MNKVEFEKDEIIFKEGDKADGFYLVNKGSVVLLKEKDKMYYPVQVIGSKDVAGDISVFLKTKRTVTAIANSYCELVKIDKASVGSRIDDAPIWVNSLITTLMERYSSLLDVMSEDTLFESIKNENAGNFSTRDLQLFKQLIDSK